MPKGGFAPARRVVLAGDRCWARGLRAGLHRSDVLQRVRARADLPGWGRVVLYPPAGGDVRLDGSGGSDQQAVCRLHPPVRRRRRDPGGGLRERAAQGRCRPPAPGRVWRRGGDLPRRGGAGEDQHVSHREAAQPGDRNATRGPWPQPRWSTSTTCMARTSTLPRSLSSSPATSRASRQKAIARAAARSVARVASGVIGDGRDCGGEARRTPRDALPMLHCRPDSFQVDQGSKEQLCSGSSPTASAVTCRAGSEPIRRLHVLQLLLLTRRSLLAGRVLRLLVAARDLLLDYVDRRLRRRSSRARAVWLSHMNPLISPLPEDWPREIARAGHSAVESALQSKLEPTQPGRARPGRDPGAARALLAIDHTRNGRLASRRPGRRSRPASPADSSQSRREVAGTPSY